MKPLLSLFLLLLAGIPKAFATRYYVKTTGTGSSWATAAGNLKTLLDAAQYGDEIWVAAGTYKPTNSGDQTACFQLQNGVSLYGGFSGTETQLSQRDSTGATKKTVLTGEINEDTAYANNSYIVVTGTNLDSTTVFDGFTVTRGYGIAQNMTYGFGGGIFIKGGNPVLKNLIIAANKARFGGGIALQDSRLIIRNTTIKDNFATIRGGGLDGEESRGILDVTLEKIIFLNNESELYGGGAYFQNGAMTGKDLSFQNNKATWEAAGLNAPSVFHISRATFTGNRLTGSQFARAAGLSIYGSGTLDNALFDNNSATEGGAMWLLALGPCKFTNITFGKNTASDSGNQVYVQVGNNVVFENCIFDSVANGKAAFSGRNTLISPVVLKNSLLRGSLSRYIIDSGGNLPLRIPGFVNAAAGNYQLQASSRAVNAGSNAAVAGIPKDLLLKSRIYNNGRVDMGAYEYQGAGTNAVTAISEKPASQITVFPNPATRFLHLKSTAGGTFTLYNLVGIPQLNYVLPANNGEATLPLQNLPAGLYNWQFQTEEGSGESGKLFIEQ